MQGQRINADSRGHLELPPGAYGESEGVWWCRPPRGGITLIDGPVEEHPDGTITVHRRLRFPEWCGFLERGVWREAPC